MKDSRISPLMLIGIVLALAAAVLVGFFGLGTSSPAPVTEPVATVKPSAPSTQQPAISPVNPLRSDPGPAPSTPPPASDTPDAMPLPPAAASAEQRAREDADMKIGTILAQNPTVEGARDKLLLLYPSMTPFEKIAAAPHINNLVGDDQLQTVVGFLKNPLTPAEAQETFFNDMLNRPPQIGWPVLIEVLATPNHPLAARAKELLTTIVGQDYGNDVFGWQRGLRDQLKLQGALPEDAPPTTSQAAPAQGQ